MEGHGPHGAGKQYHHGVAHGAAHVRAQQSDQRRFQSGLDGHGQGKAAHQLNGLHIPDGPGVKVDKRHVQPPCRQQPQRRAQQLPRVFHAVGQIFNIYIRREAVQRHEQQISHGQGDHHRNNCGHQAGPAVAALHDGIEHQQQDHGGDGGHPHVQRCVDAQIHAGKGHQHSNDNGGHPHPFAAGKPGDTAEGAHGVLGMSAGKGVAGGLGAGTLHDGEIAVQHPRAGDAAQQLQKLIQHRPGKAHRQQIVAVTFADAPEHKQGHHHKDGLLPQPGDEGHGGIEKRCTNGLQSV